MAVDRRHLNYKQSRVGHVMIHFRFRYQPDTIFQFFFYNLRNIIFMHIVLSSASWIVDSIEIDESVITLRIFSRRQLTLSNILVIEPV